MAIFNQTSLEEMSLYKFINVTDNLDEQDAKKLVNCKNLDRIQSQDVLKSVTLNLLNEAVFKFRPDINLRFYCLAKDSLDLSFVEHLSNVKKLHIDNADKAYNFEALSCLQTIENLNLDISSLSSLDFLKLVNKNLHTLRLHRSTSKKTDLSVLERFDRLKVLYIQGHRKNIESLKFLKALTDLSLAGLTVDNLDFLAELNSLKELSLDLVNRESLISLKSVKTLTSLSLKEIRNLEDLSFLEEMKSLKHIQLRYLNKIKSLPRIGSKDNLEAINILELKELNDLSNINECVNLQRFFFSGRTKLNVTDFEKIIQLPAMKSIRIGTASKKKNDVIKKLIESQGIDTD
jgi:hypothetical protein